MNSPEIFTTRRVAIGLALLLLGAFVGPATGMTTFFYRDFGVLGYPTAAYHRELFWRGELPLWNPYSNCGVPFLAQWGTMTLYPLTLIYLLLPFPWSLNFFCLAHLWWGGVGVFKLARRWTGSSEGAAFAAVLFVFNGITLSTLSWPNYTAAFAWMPWILFFAPSIRLVAFAGTMQMLVGAPEITLLTWLAVGGYWVVAQRDLKSFRQLATAILVIAALSAIQLLPFFELLSLSQRQTGAIANKWSMPIAGVWNFMLPMLHAFRTPQGTIFQHEQHFLSSTYLGMPAVLLAVLGFLRGGKVAKLLSALTALCILMAFGTNLPGFSLVQKLPVLGLVRYPVKFLLLLPLTISLGTAYGIATLDWKTFWRGAVVLGLIAAASLGWVLEHPYQYDWRTQTISNSVVRFAVFLGFAGCVFAWRKTARPFYIFTLIGIVFVEGRFHLANQNPTTEMKTLRAAIGSRPLPHLGEGRVFISRAAEDALLKSNVPDLDQDFIGKQLAVWSHLNLVELVPKVNGSATLQLRQQKEIQDWLYSGTNVNFEAWLDFLGVTKITAPNSVVDWIARTNARALLQISSTDTPISFPDLIKADLNPHLPAQGEVADLHITPGKITALVKSQIPQTLIFAQSWHPAWTARINGQPAEVFRAKYAFQGLRIPAGESHVEIDYNDARFTCGAAISLLTLAGCCLFGWRRKDRAGE